MTTNLNDDVMIKKNQISYIFNSIQIPEQDIVRERIWNVFSKLPLLLWGLTYHMIH